MVNQLSIFLFILRWLENYGTFRVPYTRSYSVKDLFVSWMGGVKYAEFGYVEGYPDVLDVVHMEGVQC